MSKIVRIVVHCTGDADGVGAHLGPDKQRLGIVVADTADGGTALHLVKNILEPGTERGCLYAVNLSL